MPGRAGAESRDVDGWLVAGATVLAVLCGWVGVRRRAARRAAEARARLRARRSRVPLVSANVQGLAAGKPDIWREEAEGAKRDGRAA